MPEYRRWQGGALLLLLTLAFMSSPAAQSAPQPIEAVHRLARNQLHRATGSAMSAAEEAFWTAARERRDSWGVGASALVNAVATLREQAPDRATQPDVGVLRSALEQCDRALAQLVDDQPGLVATYGDVWGLASRLLDAYEALLTTLADPERPADEYLRRYQRVLDTYDAWRVAFSSASALFDEDPTRWSHVSGTGVSQAADGLVADWCENASTPRSRRLARSLVSAIGQPLPATCVDPE